VSGRQVTTALLAVAPFVLVALVVRSAVPAFGDRIARRLASIAGVLRTAPSTPRMPLPPSTLHDAASGAVSPAVPGATVHVPATAIERALFDNGAHIHARWSGAEDGAPPGVRLTGVSALGVGLRDGDIVTSIEGVPAPDAETATDEALEVIARGSAVLHATVQRGDQVLALTADLPAAAPPETQAGKAR
jgi:hypothetical protein